MLSRVIAGEAAREIPPVIWKRVDGGTIQPMAPAGSGEAGGLGLEIGPAGLQRRLSELENELKTREERARAEGFEQGRAAAIEEVTEPLKEALNRAASHIEELSLIRRKLRSEAEEDLVRLAIAVARRILHRELTTDPGAILGIVKAALGKIDAREILRIRVHPDDAAILERFLAAREMPARVEVAAETGLERGSLLIDTSRGTLDASVKTQLEEIERGFTDLVHGNSL